MLRRSLFLGFAAALLGAAFVFFGCKQEAPGGGNTTTLLHYDTEVDGLSNLAEAFKTYSNVAVRTTSGTDTLTANLEIPAGKSVGLFSSLDVSTFEITGTMYVETGGSLKAADLTKIASVQITGGTLEYSGTPGTKAELQTVFNKVGSGTLKASVTAIPLSDILDIGLTASRRLEITTTKADDVVTANTTVTIPSGLKITVGEAGVVTVEAGGVVKILSGGVLATAGTTAKGKVVFGKTEFSDVGTWTASVSTAANDNLTGVSITSAAEGATIAAIGPASGAQGTATLTAGGTSPAITQATGSGNNLAISANTTVNLGGTSAAVGSIKLSKGADPGKLSLDTGSTVLTLAAGTEGTAYANTITSIDADAVITGIDRTAVFHDSNKLTKLAGGASAASVITGSATGPGVNTINSGTATAGT
ncbi:MAG: hypothetical protein LBO04_01360 [Spirochaetaceae bacterium]|jgi:hypothetical protein|nr:hypothetical protein [Spirochaetaceae bacterium]